MASEVTQTQIDALERVLDRVFKEVGIDVEVGGDIKKTATNNLEPTFHDEEDPSSLHP